MMRLGQTKHRTDPGSALRRGAGRSRSGSELGDAVGTFIRREDAERFVEDVRRDDPEVASYLRIEERKLEAGGAELRRGRGAEVAVGADAVREQWFGG